ncbi:reverse transcriptase domain-containing protein [Tanacetum coccineum]
MPFGLKNNRATYQRLIDKAFEKQIGRNLEVYVDNVVTKIHTEQEILIDIEETFQILRKINMKLNPKKCTFGAEEGMFLGHVINMKGIKACLDKAEAVIKLQLLRTLKEARALQAPKINYNSMEKLVLALCMTQGGRRYFQAYMIVVITYQPIKQIVSRPDNAKRMAKWTFELEAYDIYYRPRTSIRG